MLPPLCFITPDNIKQNTIEILLKAGIQWIQCRSKSISRKEFYYASLKIRELTKAFNALLIVNDYPDLAIAIDADGVHLGQDDLPLKEARKIMGSKIIGISTHSIEEAVKAEKEGADYIGFGAIFPTLTKKDAAVRGVEMLRKVCESVKIPVIAIGGINISNARQAFEAGCSAIAVSSGLLKEPIEANTKNFLDII